ncbi:golgin subfamily A member 6-like protein 22 [Palaemon carinicauda]|uniref:golgin subfamily A member 6-like protein 22 n=1 Tax=Palaemon carinicauda TaxID=392227 RepID=UPI0035B587F6
MRAYMDELHPDEQMQTVELRGRFRPKDILEMKTTSETIIERRLRRREPYTRPRNPYRLPRPRTLTPRFILDYWANISSLKDIPKVDIYAPREVPTWLKEKRRRFNEQVNQTPPFQEPKRDHIDKHHRDEQMQTVEVRGRFRPKDILERKTKSETIIERRLRRREPYTRPRNPYRLPRPRTLTPRLILDYWANISPLKDIPKVDIYAPREVPTWLKEKRRRFNEQVNQTPPFQEPKRDHIDKHHRDEQMQTVEVRGRFRPKDILERKTKSETIIERRLRRREPYTRPRNPYRLPRPRTLTPRFILDHWANISPLKDIPKVDIYAPREVPTWLKEKRRRLWEQVNQIPPFQEPKSDHMDKHHPDTQKPKEGHKQPQISEEPEGKHKKEEPVGKHKKEEPVGKYKKGEPVAKHKKEEPVGKRKNEEPVAKRKKEEPLGKHQKEQPVGKRKKEEPVGKRKKEEPVGKGKKSRKDNKKDKRDKGEQDKKAQKEEKKVQKRDKKEDKKEGKRDKKEEKKEGKRGKQEEKKEGKRDK